MIALSGPRGATFGRQQILIVAIVLTFFLWTWHWMSSSPWTPKVHPSNRNTRDRYWSISGAGSLEGVTTFNKPKDLNKIVGIIFYGRPATVSILDCYLKRNLVKNGGMLDEVVWIMRTNITQDIAWLNTLMQSEPAYSQWHVNFTDGDYRGAYDPIENGTMYIKIDDDIVFMEDTAIPSIVEAKYNHPEYYIVSANVMNQPSLSYVHFRLGAVLPYLPDLTPPSPSQKVPEDLSISWKASELPRWSSQRAFNMSLNWESTYPKHRWLPVDRETTNKTIDDTPIISTTFDPFGEGFWHWQIAAQEHYSFFENLENNELYRYKFHTWDYNYTRMGIQFVAMMGEDINLAKPLSEGDDEFYFSQVMPEKTRRRKFTIHQKKSTLI
jgi:hypothetical protein